MTIKQYKLLPVEPTGRILTAIEVAIATCSKSLARHATIEAAYKAAIEAAPKHGWQEPVAVVFKHEATVRLEWASVTAAHNATPGPLYTTPPDTTAVRQALDEWIEKTEWLQKTATPAELGMHRADVLAKRLTDTLNVLASAHCGYQAKLRELETQKNELLKQALEALSTCSGVAHWPTLEPVKDKLRAAIAKAEGGAA